MLAAIAFGVYLMLQAYAARAAGRAYDQLLLASALTIADAVTVEDGSVAVDLPYAALAILGTGRRDRVFYRIAAADGTPVTGYADLGPRLAPARTREPHYADLAYRGVHVRAVVLGRFLAASPGGGWVMIVVAQTLEERSALAAEILANAFLSVALTVMAAALLIWFGVRQALTPLATIERHIRRREPADLTPIELPAPVEVRQLIAALNHFMQRLQTNLRLMQTFLADAAHQIRTPLATLRAQADLAVEEQDACSMRSYLHKIHRNAALASQVTNQLLSHAMVTHRSQLAAPEPVDLVALLRQVAHRAELGGSGPPLELDLRDLSGSAVVLGDATSLREGFTNLLDNARNYAGDRLPVQIRVASAPDASGFVVEIADRGPGIPDREKGRVLERFGRGSGGRHVPGSGLGLAIVKAVAEAHGASLRLIDRPGGGLVVRLRFPSAGAPRPMALVLAILLLVAPVAGRAETFLYPAQDAEQESLLIHAATDRALMEPVLRDFQATAPGVAIRYVDLSTNELFASVTQSDGLTAPDLVLSSAMDLQAKLVNDGWTQPHASAATARVPSWANWRNEAFGFTLEPAVIVLSREGLPERPRSRPELIQLLRSQPERFRRKVATYDIVRSGVGYLFATQDSVLSSQFWRLVLALGDVDVRLLENSAAMLAAMERGELLIAYNVLGSYARARQLAGAAIEIVEPSDYTLVMSRVAAIPAAARHASLARRFLDHLLSERGQQVLAATASVQPIAPFEAARGPRPTHPIGLGPPLLVYLDPLKRSRFLANWSASIHRP